MKNKKSQSASKSDFLFDAAFIVLLVLSIFHAIKQIVGRMTCELQYSFTWDNPIYWTVGRGYLNGLKPYSDLFETKPPGIFLLSAFSFAVSGDVFIGNIFCFVCLMIIGSVPLISALLIFRIKPIGISMKSLIYGCSLAFGMSVMLYSQIRSGQMQVESLGAAFICLYLLMVFNMDTNGAKPYSLRIIIASFFIMCGVMFKEPFLLVAIASVFLFINSVKEMMYKLVWPLCYGGIMGVIVMIFTGTLHPYMTIYLPHMVGNHVSVHGSPLERGLDIRRLLVDLGSFSGGLQTAVIILAAVSIFLLLTGSRNDMSPKKTAYSVYTLIKGLLMVYLVSFSVGLGGQYYNHHYVFTVPFYVGLFMFIMLEVSPHFDVKSDNKQLNMTFYKTLATIIMAVLLLISSAVFYLLPDYRYDQNVLAANPVMRQQAGYVDGLLDHFGIERYQYLGFNGNRFYGLTEHSPLGPLFIQDPNNFKAENTWFTQNLLQQMKQAEILIVEKLNAPVLNDVLGKIISEDFTTEPWDESYEAEVPEDFEYTIYYRVQGQ